MSYVDRLIANSVASMERMLDASLVYGLSDRQRRKRRQWKDTGRFPAKQGGPRRGSLRVRKARSLRVGGR